MRSPFSFTEVHAKPAFRKIEEGRTDEHDEATMKRNDSPALRPPSRKIITVDDDPPIRSLIRHTLKQEDY
ncbi:MAG: hypothetical protein ONA90_07770, partial [candidate division KSB1 bacterium]|nr:hypothetical protein [candidate division KSB1 bacterium]